MNATIRKLMGVAIMLLEIGASPLGALKNTATASETVPLTLEQFPTAETQDSLGKWFHARGFTPIERQTVR